MQPLHATRYTKEEKNAIKKSTGAVNLIKKKQFQKKIEKRYHLMIVCIKLTSEVAPFECVNLYSRIACFVTVFFVFHFDFHFSQPTKYFCSFFNDADQFLNLLGFVW